MKKKQKAKHAKRGRGGGSSGGGGGSSVASDSPAPSAAGPGVLRCRHGGESCTKCGVDYTVDNLQAAFDAGLSSVEEQRSLLLDRPPPPPSGDEASTQPPEWESDSEGEELDLMFCDHGLEYCHRCCVDYRDMNVDTRREGEVEALRTRNQKCAVCSAKARKRCSGCGTTWYCSRECAKADWAPLHRAACKGGAALPVFYPSLREGPTTSYPPGTTVLQQQTVAGRGPTGLKCVILRFNAPGQGCDPLEKLATYTMRVVGNSSETVDEPCEDVHDPLAWRKEGDPAPAPAPLAPGVQVIGGITFDPARWIPMFMADGMSREEAWRRFEVYKKAADRKPDAHGRYDSRF
mmetsp:Transcript_19869/g.64651  ORF Transcript_19869/g.64651 Transcript_19869/m.64651 type:complete len:348 (-) Transcript_19869:1230-2273(-)